MDKENENKKSQLFENEMIDILMNLLQDKVRQTLEFLMQTHNADGLKAILKLLEEFTF